MWPARSQPPGYTERPGLSWRRREGRRNLGDGCSILSPAAHPVAGVSRKPACLPANLFSLEGGGSCVPPQLQRRWASESSLAQAAQLVREASRKHSRIPISQADASAACASRTRWNTSCERFDDAPAWSARFPTDNPPWCCWWRDCATYGTRLGTRRYLDRERLKEVAAVAALNFLPSSAEEAKRPIRSRINTQSAREAGHYPQVNEHPFTGSR